MNEDRTNSPDAPQPSRIDELTRLPNRATFTAHLEEVLGPSYAQRPQRFALLVLDCDKFKTINDSLGHQAGDQLLVAMVGRLQAVLAEGTLLARIDGDEFGILLTNIDHLMQALSTAERILRDLEAPFTIAAQEVFISVSIGIATSEANYSNAADVLRDADTALAHAKQLGRGRYSVFAAPMHARAVQRLKMETELRRALKQEELRVYYQPIVDLTTGIITGFEALVRWQHPERQLLTPIEFLPMAEELGLSVAIDRWVLRESCRQMQEWISTFPTMAHLTISVNMSGQQFEQPDLVNVVRTMLQKTRLPPQNLNLELTEDTVIAHKDIAIKTLQRLRAMGIRVSLDDFGTGYSSLSYLHHLPLTTLKVDRSFISSMDVSPQAAIVSNAIITLAHALGMDVVAEGIETQQHLTNLRTANCERAQGFLFSRPVDVTRATTLLEEARQRIAAIPGYTARTPESQPPSSSAAPGASATRAVGPPAQPSIAEPAPPAAGSPGRAAVAQEEPIEQQIDPLTGAHTRASLQARLDAAVQASTQTGAPFALAVIDLDHFKSVNDAFGHSRGDDVLIEFTERVRMATHTRDSIVRYGGDEFVLLLPETDGEQARIFAERLLDMVRSEPFRGDPPLSLTISMGLAIFPNDSQTTEDLFKVADERNYQAKRAGRGRAILHNMPRVETVVLDGPGRLIERDQQLQTLHTFLHALSHQRRGILQLIGAEGNGITRFLAEASRAARLQRYGVLELCGSPALKERVYGVLSNLSDEWQDLPSPCHGVGAFVSKLLHVMARKNYTGIVITLDEVALIDPATIEFLHNLFAAESENLSCLGLVYATNGAETTLHLAQSNVLHLDATLEPVSLNGLRTWVRHSLNWEMPETLLLWFYNQTGGRPAAIRQGLGYLVEHEMIYPAAGGWNYWPDITATRIAAHLDKQTTQTGCNLPMGQPDFVGREADITQVKHLLTQQHAVVITGLGGLGKSRLAIQAAAETLETFADGVCYVQLAHLSSTEFLIYTVADALGVTLVGAQSPREQVLFHLSTRNMLLLLDNFEHLREETPLLEEIVERAPGVHLLVTSRDRLVFAGGVTFELGRMPYPISEQELNIEHYSSVQLFARRARQSHTDFALAPENMASVGRICRLVEGLPLGIELAAAWTRTFSCEAIADKIALNLSFLQQEDSRIAERHRNLMAVIDSFWFMLSNHERGLLRQMSVFRGGFDGKAARTIIDASPFFLEGLVAKGYVRWTRNKRYEIHELLRQYAAEKLHALPDEALHAAEHHSIYYLALVQQRDLQQFGSRHMLDEITANLGNIRTAWQWAVHNDRLAELAQSIDGFEDFYEFSGMFHEAEALFGAAAAHLQATGDAATTADPTRSQLIGRLQAVQARFLNRCARYDDAIEAARLVQESAATLEDEGLAAISSYHWGTALFYQGVYDTAHERLTHVAALAQRLQLAQLHADSLRRLTRVACEMGKYAEARAYGEQSLALCRQLGERQRETRMLNDLGIVADSQGDYIASKTYYEHCLQLSRELGDQPGECIALINLGVVAADQGDYSVAEGHLEQALHFCRASGARREEALVLENLGDSARWQGALDQATTFYDQAFRICRKIGDQQGQSYLLGNLGLVAHQRGDQTEARSATEQALDIAQRIGDSRAQGNALTYLGHACSGLGAFDIATARYEQAVQLYRSLGQLHLSTDALAGLARLALQRAASDEALRHIEPILEHLQAGTLDGTAEPFRIYLTCYQVLAPRADERYRVLLVSALERLHQQASRIASEERRHLFLYQTPVHQALIAAAAEHQIEVAVPPATLPPPHGYRQIA